MNQNRLEVFIERVVNPVKCFLDEAIAEESLTSEYIVKEHLYEAYLKYCKIYNFLTSP
ncbi:hypothetical protein BH23THE1_BH23THE1_13460 [soil metagenome]